jgi:hypothetical protein
MKKLLSFCLPAIAILVFFGCQKTPDQPDTPKIDPLEEMVTASLQGRVIDENGKPVGNASVKSGSNLTTTDINGTFKFNNIQLAKNAGFVLVEKTGYLHGSRSIFTNTGVVNNVEIQLIPRTIRGTFAGSAGGSVAVQSGSSINFPANGIINTANNSAYTGTVTVVGAYLDPTDPKLAAIMPGNLTGLTTNNEQKLLQTFGMIGIELEGSAGEKLNIASGKTATLTMPIPTSLQASAPATIPLWYFDETKGIWVEEGSATKQGTNYVGTVSHFSFWNCDVPNNFVNLKMTVKTQDNLPAKNYKVSLRNTVTNAITYGITDSTGFVSGAIPVNVPLEMKVYNRCDEVLLTQTVGPFSASSDLGIVTIPVTTPGIITISGTVTNCSSSPVTNGFVDFSLEGLNYRAPVSNGNFSITINKCNNATSNVTITGTDVQATQQSSSLVLAVSSGSYSTGAISACGVSTAQFMNFTIGDITINFAAPPDSLTGKRNGTTTIISGNSPMQTDTMGYRSGTFKFTGAAAAGSYTIDSSSLFVTKGIGFTQEYNLNSSATVTITEYGNQGQFIAGTFTATFIHILTNTPIPGTCNFRVKRF